MPRFSFCLFKSTMRNLTVMFVTAVCFLFLLKLKWPKNKNISDRTILKFLKFLTKLPIVV